MEKINLFNKKYINLFCYGGDGIEFFQSIMFSLGYSYKELSSLKVKKDTLYVIEELLKLKLIEVFLWGEKHSEMKDKEYSIEEILKYINSIWFDEADYPDFYGMVMFKHKEWYTHKLEKLGMTHTTDWKWFVENKIGNLEKWIQENKPNEV